MLTISLGYIWLNVQQHHLNLKQWSNKISLILIRNVVLCGLLLLIFGSPFTPSLVSFFRKNAAPTTAQPTTVAAVNRLDEGGTDSGEIRKIVWEGSLNIWKRYPLFGSGVETFAYSYYQDRPLAHNNVSEWDFLYNKAHNEFLNFLATTGVVGLATYSALLGWFGIVILRTLFSNSSAYSLQEKQILVGLLSGIIALTVSNFFGFSTVPVSVLLFLCLAIAAIIKDNSPEEVAHRLPISGTQKAIVGGIFLIGGWLVLRVLNMWTADHNYYLGKSYLEAGYTVQGVTYLQTAVKDVPTEALYHDELSSTYARLAVFYNQQQQATQAAQLAAAALEESNATLMLNDRHLNFYKTRVRVFLSLAELDSAYASAAKETIQQALTLAPTDVKLVYNLGAIEQSLGQTEAAKASFEKAVEMRPGYEAARIDLAKLYEAEGNKPAALEQYQYVYDHITQNNQFVNDTLNGITPITTPSTTP
jgi:putative inorganic carbon (hco3(-)) transporter